MEMTAGELARWLGVSESLVDHRVLPALRRSGAVSTEVMTASVDGLRRVTGLRWGLLPLAAAQAQRSGPLVLEKGELAVLLALCERLFGPGWAPVGKPETPPGLLGERRGRGAAAERLGLLRLVLAARPDGRVRLVGGAVAAGFDRADATVARLVGCPLAEAARVVDGLVRQELLEVPGRGVPGARLKILVPAVAAAHGRSQAGLEVVPEQFPQGVDEDVEAEAAPEDRGAVCMQCAGSLEDEDPAELGEQGWLQDGLFDVVDGDLVGADGALRDQNVPKAAPAEESHASDLGEQASEVSGDSVFDGAPLHAHHAPEVVAVSGSGAAEFCFSGEAAPGSPPLPERASGREDQPEAGPIEAVGHAGSPLRGEQHRDLVERQDQKAPVGGAPVLMRWSLPRGLERVLAPVRWEWARIGHAGGRHQVRAVARAELMCLAGIVGVERAPVVLAERLERRLAAQFGQPVRDPIGWLLGRGLPQRAECYASACDDRVRMDTGRVCPSCELLIEDRKALRHQAARAVAGELPMLEPEAFRAEVERRLSREVAWRAAEEAVRRERATVERARREEAWARQREEQAVARAELAARSCAECGVPEAGGLCLICSETRTARQALDSAAEFAAVAAALPDTPATAAGRLDKCRAWLEAETEQAEQRWRGQGLPEAAVVWQLRELAEQLAARERALALEGLLDGPQARAEVERVAGIERTRHRSEPEVRAAADDAARRCAQALLEQRLDRVRAEIQAPVQPRAGGWRERMAQYAARPLEGESLPAPVRPVADQEAVSAA
ncbi:hypothetical protein ACFRMQ_24705 [Kitasatospora sp. NPDC056783]|uniref:hypothetical protein n=1 Tax=Kitasatospora sp. NPDC056783 TaxID=3345943 RepID=UPI00367E7887